MDNRMIATMVMALFVGILVIAGVSALAGWQATTITGQITGQATTSVATGKTATSGASAVSSGSGMVGGC